MLASSSAPFPPPSGRICQKTWELLLEYYIRLLDKNQVGLPQFEILKQKNSLLIKELEMLLSNLHFNQIPIEINIAIFPRKSDQFAKLINKDYNNHNCRNSLYNVSQIQSGGAEMEQESGVKPRLN
jgi:hypothetical protein